MANIMNISPMNSLELSIMESVAVSLTTVASGKISLSIFIA